MADLNPWAGLTEALQLIYMVSITIIVNPELVPLIVINTVGFQMAKLVLDRYGD